MSNTPTTATRAGWGECLAAGLALACIIGCQFAVVSHFLKQPLHYPWTKPFWLDEFHTLSVAAEPSLTEQMSKLARGGDYNPPGLYLLLYGWKTVTGSANEWSLRLFSFTATLLALVGLYWLLRQSFGRLVAFVVTLGVWCGNPILVDQAFEARFYAPWLAGCVWLCVGLVLLDRRPRWWPAWLMVAVFSALVCTVHYFGIFALCLIVPVHMALHFRGIAAAARTALLTSAGPLALGCCAPFYLGQRAVLGGQTWVRPSSLWDVVPFIGGTSTWLVLTLVAALFFLDSLLPACANEEKLPRADTRPLAGVFSLLLLPLVIILFSFVVQPAMIHRYAFPTLVGVAPVLALVAAPVRRWLLAASLPVVVLYGAFTSTAAFNVPPSLNVIALTNRVAREVPGNTPIVFRERKAGYVAARYSEVESGRIRMVFPEEIDKADAFDQVEAKVTDRMAELFPELPSRIGGEELRRERKVILIAASSVETLRGLYPGSRLRKLDAQGAYSAYLVEMANDADQKP